MSHFSLHFARVCMCVPHIETTVDTEMKHENEKRCCGLAVLHRVLFRTHHISARQSDRDRDKERGEERKNLVFQKALWTSWQTGTTQKGHNKSDLTLGILTTNSTLCSTANSPTGDIQSQFSNKDLKTYWLKKLVTGSAVDYSLLRTWKKINKQVPRSWKQSSLGLLHSRLSASGVLSTREAHQKMPSVLL